MIHNKEQNCKHLKWHEEITDFKPVTEDQIY